MKGYNMSKSDKNELAAYRELGTLEELRRMLKNPFPITDDFAPLPWSDEEAPIVIDDWEEK